MRTKSIPFWLVALLVLGLLAPLRPIAAEPREFELVLVLDESGSMKRTDPDGLRAEAARLFLRLCGAPQRVGLTGFSTDIRVLAEMQPLDESGRERLLEATRDIRSDGQDTRIEKALRQALDDLRNLGAGAEMRAVLLMTDGQVDLGLGEEADQASIERLRSELTKEYIQSGAQIFCLAYSDEADFELLRYLADATGGLCVRGDREEELQKLFLRIFEELAQPQTLPLSKGQARIDDSIREATFLVAHDPDSPPVTLTDPDGETWTQREAERADHIQWFASPRYDLVTVTRPQPGIWTISPARDHPENRVLVLTDIELRLSDFPRSIHRNEDLTLGTALFSQDSRVQAPEILQRLRIEAVVHDNDAQGATGIYPLADDGRHNDAQPDDGLYAAPLPPFEKPGDYRIEIFARTPTLERRISRTLKVQDRWYVVALEREVLQTGEPAVLKIQVLNPAQAASLEALRFRASIRNPGGQLLEVPVQPLQENRLYTVAFDKTTEPGDYRIAIVGQFDKDGRTLQETVGPLDFRVRAQAPPRLALPDETESAHQTHTQTTAAPTPTQQAHPTQPPEAQVAHEHETAQPTPESHPTAEDSAIETKDQASAGTPLLLYIGGGILAVLLACAGLLLYLILRRESGRAQPAPSMEKLRKKARDIRREEPQTVAAATTAEAETVIEEVPEAQAPATTELEPEPEPEPEPERPEPQAETEESEQTDAERDDVALPDDDDENIIPAAEPDASDPAISQLTEGETEEADTPETPPEEASPQNEGESLSENEANLLAEIMNEVQEPGAVKDAPQPPPAEAEAAPAEPEPEPEPDHQPEMEAQPAAEAATDQSQEDLLKEIMGEIEGAGTAPEPAAETDSSQSEQELLDEIMSETSEGAAEGGARGGGTPTIPDEEDKKSDQDAIDDILAEIDKLVE